MRMAIASPGNDFRLGACEAPPAIISMYLGNDMSEYLESYIGMSLRFTSCHFLVMLNLR
jgi:glutamine synthetase type III